MNKLYKYAYIFAVLSLMISACGAPTIQTQRVAPTAVDYQSMLGKSLGDPELVDFITANNCVHAMQFQTCKEAGIALWLDSNRTVRTVYLYVNNADNFATYKGDLPFGMKYYDILGAVEYKLKRREVGNEGRPDEGSSPDHLHYWAVYKQAGMTVIYNAPYPDEDATIYAILVSR